MGPSNLCTNGPQGPQNHGPRVASRLHGSASATAATPDFSFSSSPAVVEGRRAAAPATGHRKGSGVVVLGSEVGCGDVVQDLAARGAASAREQSCREFGKQYNQLLSRSTQPTFCPNATTSSDRDDGSQSKEKISVTFVNKDGTEQTISVPVGMSILEAAHENDIELEGACEGSLACSTCHVIVMDVNYYNKLEDPTDEENDMLDLAFGLTETSRLGCQVIAKPELDGMRLALPAATRNFAVDGFVPKPH
uniref:2Fe-2S ferredoxin-type domain-containing protein n=1 Tax=Oryza rufipogon TaxID=4529 RepID=A0A0E0Q396_ORYRU